MLTRAAVAQSGKNENVSLIPLSSPSGQPEPLLEGLSGEAGLLNPGVPTAAAVLELALAIRAASVQRCVPRPQCVAVPEP